MLEEARRGDKPAFLEIFLKNQIRDWKFGQEIGLSKITAKNQDKYIDAQTL